ncbi:MAG: hypothetical protein IPO51_14070 [Dehalococcoidia bacterium]|nr:hypothetical protein [Dehalococcoidia bacterium]
MTVRISVDRLPPEVVEALDRGDTVVFERLGKVTAVARPGETSGSRLWHELAKLAPLDSEFEADVAALSNVVVPQGSAWAS